jgi:ubiquinone/menaquinone biosynthesis C-methylase UbiE
MEYLQESNRNYWNYRAQGYSEYNKEELSDERKKMWSDTLVHLISTYLPYRKPHDIKVLDIGTGPGFFALLLAEAGYQVIAVDSSLEMIKEAKKNTRNYEDSITFILGDAQNLEFEENSFDVIVTRNLTWNLENPKQAYAQWYRVLNTNGVLFNFDADWYGYLFDETKKEEYEAERKNVAKHGLEDYNIGENFDIMEEIAKKMPLSRQKRPKWDLNTMEEVGFSYVYCDTQIWKKVWNEIEVINHSSRKLFLLVGQKDERKKRISSYWDNRSETFLVQRRNELHNPIANRWLQEINHFIPSHINCKILDLGCGTGYFSILLAKQGHEVTGIDLTSQMIENAKILAKEEEVECTFLTMDAENLKFKNESFDFIITRNLTWTLPHVQQAYREWLRVLKTGGKLINFDANYGFEDTTDMSNLSNYHAHHMLNYESLVENNTIKTQLPISYHSRPAWDVEVLGHLGCEKIEIDLGVSKRIYLEQDQFYNPTPLFLLVVKK